MPFPRHVRDQALVKSHRRCCVCHEFGGRSVNVHHIIQEAYGGANLIENAICLCLRCHAEAGHFNSHHPMGTKYSPEELRAHRDQWWLHCESHPDEPYSPELDIRFKSVSRTSRVHRYRLLASYTNPYKEAHNGWKIQIFVPKFVPVEALDYDHFDKRLDGVDYHLLENSSGEKVYPGETIEVVQSIDDFFFIEYEVNDRVFQQLHEDPRILWRFFTDNAPVLEGQRSLSEMQEF